MQIIFTEKIKNNYDLTILGIYEENKFSQSTTKFDKETKGIISKSIKNSTFKGKIGDTLLINSEKTLLIGLGNSNNLDTLHLNKIGGIIGKTIEKEKIKNALLYLDNLNDEKNFEISFGAKLKTYKFDKYITKDTKEKQPEINLYIHSENPKKAQNDFSNTNAIIDGIITTRNLATEPSNILTTTEFANTTKKLSKLGIKVEIIDEKELKKMGANLILAVGQGSKHPSYIAVMKYTGNKRCITMNSRSTTLSIGALFAALGGAAALVMMFADFNVDAENLFAGLSFYLLVAALFFAVAGSFSKNSQWSYGLVIAMNLVIAAIIIAGIVISFISWQYGLVLLVLLIVELAVILLAKDAKVWFPSA